LGKYNGKDVKQNDEGLRNGRKERTSKDEEGRSQGWNEDDEEGCSKEDGQEEVNAHPKETTNG